MASREYWKLFAKSVSVVSKSLVSSKLSLEPLLFQLLTSSIDSVKFSAVVYLVREVLFDPGLEPEPIPLDSTLSQTPKASDGFASLSKLDTLDSSRTKDKSQVVYGRDFALKCLCKRNLSDELLVLQRGEAELHRSLPLHNNIVALHRVGALYHYFFKLAL